MNDLKVRAFKDGSALVLYFEDVSTEIEDIVKGILKPLIESDSMLEQPEKENDDPVIPEGCGRYSGKRVSDVLLQEGNKGYANIVYMKDTMKVFNTRDTMAVIDILNRYIVDSFSGIEPQEYAGSLTEPQADEWIKCFDSLISPETKKEVINLTGFSSYEDFTRDGSYEQKVSLIYKVLKGLGLS